MKPLIPIIDKILVPVSRNQTFVIVILLMLVWSVYEYKKEDKYYTAIQELVQVIKEREIGTVSKAGALFICEQTYASAKYRIAEEVSKIILQNNVGNPYKQVEIKDLLNHRIKYFYKMDYAGMTEFNYNGVQLSYLIKDVRTDLIVDSICTTLFLHYQSGYVITMAEIDRTLDSIFNDIYSNTLEQMNKI